MGPLAIATTSGGVLVTFTAHIVVMKLENM